MEECGKENDVDRKTKNRLVLPPCHSKDINPKWESKTGSDLIVNNISKPHNPLSLSDGYINPTDASDDKKGALYDDMVAKPSVDFVDSVSEEKIPSENEESGLVQRLQMELQLAQLDIAELKAKQALARVQQSKMGRLQTELDDFKAEIAKLKAMLVEHGILPANWDEGNKTDEHHCTKKDEISSLHSLVNDINMKSKSSINMDKVDLETGMEDELSTLKGTSKNLQPRFEDTVQNTFGESLLPGLSEKKGGKVGELKGITKNIEPRYQDTVQDTFIDSEHPAHSGEIGFANAAGEFNVGELKGITKSIEPRFQDTVQDMFVQPRESADSKTAENTERELVQTNLENELPVNHSSWNMDVGVEVKVTETETDEHLAVPMASEMQSLKITNLPLSQEKTPEDTRQYSDVRVETGDIILSKAPAIEAMEQQQPTTTDADGHSLKILNIPQNQEMALTDKTQHTDVDVEIRDTKQDMVPVEQEVADIKPADEDSVKITNISKNLQMNIADTMQMEIVTERPQPPTSPAVDKDSLKLTNLPQNKMVAVEDTMRYTNVGTEPNEAEVAPEPIEEARYKRLDDRDSLKLTNIVQNQLIPLEDTIQMEPAAVTSTQCTEEGTLDDLVTLKEFPVEEKIQNTDLGADVDTTAVQTVQTDVLVESGEEENSIHAIPDQTQSQDVPGEPDEGTDW